MEHTQTDFDSGNDYADIVEDLNHNETLIKSNTNDFFLNNKIKFNNNNKFGHSTLPKSLNNTKISNAQLQETDYVSICPSSTMA